MWWTKLRLTTGDALVLRELKSVGKEEDHFRYEMGKVYQSSTVWFNGVIVIGRYERNSRVPG